MKGSFLASHLATLMLAAAWSYLPTAWAVQQSGDSSQHSLWTWITWFGANLTTAAWLYEMDGRHLSRVSTVCACNATMCLAITVLIVWYRL